MWIRILFAPLVCRLTGLITIYGMSLRANYDSKMIWLTKRMNDKWYVCVRCEQCATQSVLFPDESKGVGPFECA